MIQRRVRQISLFVLETYSNGEDKSLPPLPLKKLWHIQGAESKVIRVEWS